MRGEGLMKGMHLLRPYVLVLLRRRTLRLVKKKMNCGIQSFFK
jgi:hypothetical protein